MFSSGCPETVHNLPESRENCHGNLPCVVNFESQRLQSGCLDNRQLSHKFCKKKDAGIVSLLYGIFLISFAIS